VANDYPDDIYSAYRYNTNTQTAFPYLYLVDNKLDNTETELNSRMVINKLHSVNFIPQSNGT
jgi:hypothetical protein